MEVLHFSADNKVSGSCYRAHDSAVLILPADFVLVCFNHTLVI